MKSKTTLIPLFSSAVKAGFPSPVDDYVEKTLDLNSFLIKNPPATYFLRVKGDSMINAGILEDDIVIVDRSLEAKNGAVVIASIDNEFTIKRFKKEKNGIWLVPENNNFKPINISRAGETVIWGVVVGLVRSSL